MRQNLAYHVEHHSLASHHDLMHLVTRSAASSDCPPHVAYVKISFVLVLCLLFGCYLCYNPTNVRHLVHHPLFVLSVRHRSSNKHVL